MDKNLKVFAAELIGTAVLMIGGPGSAILAAKGIGGALGVALAFGFSLMILAYAIGGIAVGITLALIHLVTIPVDNTSVNPARSFGAAIFAGSGALKQLWVFIVFPIIGAVVGVLAWLAVDDGKLEDTMLGDSKVMTRARDIASDAVHKAASAADKAVD